MVGSFAYFPLAPKCLTLALPWKLKVRTYSPGRVSLWRITKSPWLLAPPASTSWAARTRDSVPWNHGYPAKLASQSDSLVPSLPPEQKRNKWVFITTCNLFHVFAHFANREEMRLLRYYLQKSWSPGPLGTGGSALKACGTGAGWRGIPCIGPRGRCNARLLMDTAVLEHDTHLNAFFFLF